MYVNVSFKHTCTWLILTSILWLKKIYNFQNVHFIFLRKCGDDHYVVYECARMKSSTINEHLIIQTWPSRQLVFFTLDFKRSQVTNYPRWDEFLQYLGTSLFDGMNRFLSSSQWNEILWIREGCPIDMPHTAGMKEKKTIYIHF